MCARAPRINSAPRTICFIAVRARLLLPLSSSFFLISRGADSNDQAERTRAELYTTPPWHALIVRTCQKKRCRRKSTGRKTREREIERKNDELFFSFVSCCTRTSSMRTDGERSFFFSSDQQEEKKKKKRGTKETDSERWLLVSTVANVRALLTS